MTFDSCDQLPQILNSKSFYEEAESGDEIEGLSEELLVTSASSHITLLDYYRKSISRRQPDHVLLQEDFFPNN